MRPPTLKPGPVALACLRPNVRPPATTKPEDFTWDHECILAEAYHGSVYLTDPEGLWFLRSQGPLARVALFEARAVLAVILDRSHLETT